MSLKTSSFSTKNDSPSVVASSSIFWTVTMSSKQNFQIKFEAGRMENKGGTINYSRFFCNSLEDLEVKHSLSHLRVGEDVFLDILNGTSTCGIIIGPPRRFFPDVPMLIPLISSGKTSLLFQYACSSVTKGESVIFICVKRKIQSSLPVFLHNDQYPKTILEKIQMKSNKNAIQIY
jgi:hypothetical protein